MRAMEVFTAYTSLMDQAAQWFGVPHSTMHVHAGLAVYVVAQVVVRTRRASMAALNTVIALAVLHEVLDFFGSPNWDWADTLQDIALTSMWPVAITVVGQYRRARWQRARDLAKLYAHANRSPMDRAPVRIRVLDGAGSALARSAPEQR